MLRMLAADAVVVTAPLVFWTWLQATFMPVVTAVVVKVNAPPLFKSVANAVLTSAGGVIVYALAHDGGFDVWSAVLSSASGVFIAVAMYAGVWRKPLERHVEPKVPGGIGPTDKYAEVPLDRAA